MVRGFRSGNGHNWLFIQGGPPMTQKTNTMAALTVAGLLAVLAPAFAAQTETKGSLTQQDQKFAMNAAEGSMLEIQAGQLAVKNASSQAVKDFGQRMVTDHTKASQQLTQIASQKAMTLPKELSADHRQHRDQLPQEHGAPDPPKAAQQLTQTASQKAMTLPKELSADHRQHRDQLSKATGAQFDRLYMSHMVKAHEKDVKEFEKQAQKGDDAALRAFAEQNLPILRQHLELARTLASQVGADHGNHGNH